MRRHRQPFPALPGPAIGVGAVGLLPVGGGVAGAAMDNRKIAEDADFDLVGDQIFDRHRHGGLLEEASAIDQRFVRIGAVEILRQNLVEPLDVAILHRGDIVAVQHGEFVEVFGHRLRSLLHSLMVRRRLGAVSNHGPRVVWLILRDAAKTPLLRMRSQSSNIGGGTKPPNSRSISSASFSGVRSSSQGPTICTPTGSPSGDSPSGIAVAGRPGSVAMPGHANWSG